MRLVEIVADAGSADTVSAIAEKFKARDFRLGLIGDNGTQSMRMLVTDDKVQGTLDALQTVLGAQPEARILVLPIEIALPKGDDSERSQEDSATVARESLYDAVERNARLDVDFLVLVVLSTIVAAIGLIEDNVAVVIGAMVIAPLLGPNLALALGTALGDVGLMRKALVTTAVGIGLAITLALALGVLWPFALASDELMARTDVGLDSVALALASGAAAVLSLTTGLPTVLVGVMVAVALLPPAATLGLMLGHGEGGLAAGAALLLTVNVVCVNLASKLVFLVKGVRPRTGTEKEKAKRTMAVYILVWLATLALLVLAIVGRQALAGSF
jgi:uncharacterized hydrophobic protein (TIGR00341 family)